MVNTKVAGRYRVFCGEREVLGECVYSPALAFRMKGLLGRKGLDRNEGILLLPCNSIHMFFMAFPIDAFFLTKAGRITAFYDSIRPWRLTKLHWDTHAVLETQAGVGGELGLKVGDELEFRPSAE